MGGAIPAGGGSGQRTMTITAWLMGATLAESHLAEGSAGCDSGRAVLLVGRRHRGRLPLLRGSPLR